MSTPSTESGVRRTSIVAAAIVALTSHSTATGDDVTPTGLSYRVIDRSLGSSVGDPIVLDGDRVLLFDHPGGVPRAIPASDVLAIAVGPVAERDASPVLRTAIRRAGDDAPLVEPYLEFIDGQRLRGGLNVGPEGDPVWRSAWIRDLPFDLDRIRAVRFEAGGRVVEATDADVVVLTNGDEIRGLVESIGVELAIEVDDPAGGGPRRVDVPLHRVASVSLVNPPVPRRGAMTWLRGGQLIASSSVRIDDDGYVRLVAPALGGDVAEVPLDFLVAVLPDASQVDALSRMPVRVGPGSAAGLRPWIPPIEHGVGNHAFDAAPLELSGPMRAEFTLGSMPSKVRATFERPGESGRGRVVVVVLDGDREVERHALDQERPVVSVSVPVTSGRFAIEIEDGGDGPFRDTVLVREAIVVRSGD